MKMGWVAFLGYPKADLASCYSARPPHVPWSLTFGDELRRMRRNRRVRHFALRTHGHGFREARGRRKVLHRFCKFGSDALLRANNAFIGRRRTCCALTGNVAFRTVLHHRMGARRQRRRIAHPPMALALPARRSRDSHGGPAHEALCDRHVRVRHTPTLWPLRAVTTLSRQMTPERPNQALQPTRMLVTFCAYAQPAPSTRVADL